jgi:hypothetical protein
LLRRDQRRQHRAPWSVSDSRPAAPRSTEAAHDHLLHGRVRDADADVRRVRREAEKQSRIGSKRKSDAQW